MENKQNDPTETAPFYTEIAQAPAGGKAYWVKTSDGVRLRMGLWEAEEKSKGTVFLFSGRADYMELYGRFITSLVSIGYTVFAVDWRGHGLSERLEKDSKLGHVEQFSDYQLDVEAMANTSKELDLPKPWNLIGHSMGGAIGLQAIVNGFPVSACAFTAPMWKIKLSKAEGLIALPVSWAVQALGLGQVYCPGYNSQCYAQKVSFENNTLTNDPEMYAYRANQATAQPDLQSGGPSIGWLYQALKQERHMSKQPSPSIPCLALCGDQDELVSVEAVEERMLTWPGGKFELVPGAKHELFWEVQEVRESCLRKIDAFFMNTCDKSADYERQR